MKLLKKKKILFSLFFLIFFSIYLIYPSKCKKPKFLLSIKDFGFSIFSECFDEVSIKNSIKEKLITIKPLYKIAEKVKITFFKDFGKSREMNTSIYVKTISANDQSSKKNSFFKIDKISEDKINNFLKKENQVENLSFRKWNRAHGNNWNNKFYNSNIINEKNVKNLELKWKHVSIKKKKIKKEWKENIGINPIYNNGIIYYISANWTLNAVSVKNGKLIWSKKFFFRPAKRGFLIYEDFDSTFIFINSGSRLYKINAKNGKLIKNFGQSGSIKSNIVLSAPVVYKDQIILSDVNKFKISSYDINTGTKKFSIDIHPRNSKHFSTPWSGNALDKKNGIYFLVTGNPKPSLYGVNRPGNNENSNSLIAFDIEQKKIIWTFQEVRHDLWDFDISAPPILANLRINGKIFEAVIVTTKIGNTFVFERNSGKSLFDINYKKAPISDVPNEIVSSHQIFNTIPERFSKIEFDINDLRSSVLDDKKFLKKNILNSKWGWFMPPKLSNDVITYGINGGNNWPGSAFDPKKQILYIPVNHVPYKIRIFPISWEKKDEVNFNNFSNNYKLYLNKCSSCHKKNRNGYANNFREKELDYVPSLVGLTIFESLKKKLSYEEFKILHKDINLNKGNFNKIIKLFSYWDRELKNKNLIKTNSYWIKLLDSKNFYVNKPPWGEIVALNILTGKIIWRSPFGYKNYNDKFYRVGTKNNGGISINSGNLIFATGTNDGYASIFSSKTGGELWKYKMEAAGSAPPLIFTYENKEYVSFLSTGLSFHDSLEKSSILYTFGLNQN